MDFNQNLISCGSSEENIESFAKSHEPVSITDLKEKFNDYKGELIVFEGTVDLLCCGKRVEPIIDLKEYIVIVERVICYSTFTTTL